MKRLCKIRGRGEIPGFFMLTGVMTSGIVEQKQRSKLMNNEHDDYMEFDGMISDGMGALAWLLGAIIVSLIAVLVWLHGPDHAEKPAGCSNVECAAEGGL